MVIDILFLIFMALGIFHGYRRGFILSFFSFIAIIAAIILSMQFSYSLSVFIYERFDVSSKYLPFACFIGIFVLTIVGVNLATKALDDFIKFAQLSFLNKVAGSIFRGAIFMIIFSIILWFFNQISLISPELKVDSRVYEFVAPIGPFLIEMVSTVIPAFEDLIEQLEEYFRDQGRDHMDYVYAFSR